MWALLSTRLRTWLLLAVAVPLAGTLAGVIARRLERRNGSTKVSRALFSASDLAARRGRSGRNGRPDGPTGGQGPVDAKASGRSGR